MNNENNSWDNGSWGISQLNIDEIKITGPYNQECVICGGDFEFVLSALCAGYKSGYAKGVKDAKRREQEAQDGRMDL